MSGARNKHLETLHSGTYEKDHTPTSGNPVKVVAVAGTIAMANTLRDRLNQDDDE